MADLGLGTAPPFVRFLVVGALAVALNLALLWILVGQFRWPYLLATVVVFLAGNVWGYVANRRFTWHSTERPAPELARWYLVMGTSLVVNLAAMYALVDGVGLNYLVASVVLSLAMAIVNFAAHDRFTFQSRSGA